MIPHFSITECFRSVHLLQGFSSISNIKHLMHMYSMSSITTTLFAQMAGDGNCCFYSVALAIISTADRLRAHTSAFFWTHNLDPEQGVSDLAHRIRHEVVNEWQSNPQDYEGFVGYGNCGGRKI